MKGYELIKMLQEGKIQEGTVIQDNYNTYIYEKDKILEELTLFIKSSDDSQEVPDFSFFADINNNFEIIEDEEEIDIQSIEEVNHYNIVSAIKGKTEENIDNELKLNSLAINKLTKAVKQLEKKVNSIEQK